MSPGIKSRLLATQSDERLVALVRAGQEPAFEALVHRYRKPLLRYCRRICLSEARAEEVLQQTLMNAWVALGRDCEVREVRAWLYRIAHNAALNAIRAERATVAGTIAAGEIHGGQQAAAATAVGAADLDHVLALRDALAGMAELPQMQREVIVRTAVGGHSHTEVASALGITADAVRGLLYRARATLREGVTAVTPAPLLAWAARAGEAPMSRSERIAELAAGGTAGLTGLAVKSAAVAITTGVAITGSVIAHENAVRDTLRDPTASVLGVRPTSTGRSGLQLADAGELRTRFALDGKRRAQGDGRGGRAAVKAPADSLPALRLRLDRLAQGGDRAGSVAQPGSPNGETQPYGDPAAGARHPGEPAGGPSTAGGASVTPAEGDGGEAGGGKRSRGQGEGQGSEQKGAPEAQREGQGAAGGGGQASEHAGGQASGREAAQEPRYDEGREAPADGGPEPGEHGGGQKPPGYALGDRGEGEPQPGERGAETG
jgi:RNA polymerase sigma factor (sigma-70 family)